MSLILASKSVAKRKRDRTGEESWLASTLQGYEVRELDGPDVARILAQDRGEVRRKVDLGAGDHAAKPAARS